MQTPSDRTLAAPGDSALAAPRDSALAAPGDSALAAPRDSARAALSDSALAALSRGEKLAAIKLLRAERGIGLKAAKEAVDAQGEGNPELARALAAARRESNGRALWWLAATAAFCVLAYVVYGKVGAA